MTEGVAEIGFRRQGGQSRLDHLYQRDPLRVLFPATAAGDPPLAVIVTTSGGLVAGDRLDIDVRLAREASAHVTASAAEKVYRSTGRTTVIAQTLSAGAGAVLEYLPPETILFDGARLRREMTVDIEPDSGFLGGGIVVFGRRARGERFTRGFFHDIWQIRCAGELIWGDAVNLEENIEWVMADPACFAGAAAFATMVLAPPGRDGRGFLASARAPQATGMAPGLRAGVTTIGGLVIARWLAADAAALRRAYGDLACHFRVAALGLPPCLPRLWHA